MTIDAYCCIMYYMKRAVIALAIILALLGGTYGALLLARTDSPVDAQQTTQTIQPQELNADRIHELVNAERAKVGLQPLIRDPRLDKGAQRKADELSVEGWDDTPHYNNAGKPGLDYTVEYAPECKKPKSYENLLYGHKTEQLGVAWWMGSQSHKEAMLSPDITMVGYGVSGRFVASHMC